MKKDLAQFRTEVLAQKERSYNKLFKKLSEEEKKKKIEQRLNEIKQTLDQLEDFDLKMQDPKFKDEVMLDVKQNEFESQYLDLIALWSLWNK
ncbi:hypothetical protein EG856_00715 [Mycoplasmopsis phocirhinis]|uniref:Uncharacterized protein n=1 Tax=Mycoplasmopsis phocirhinis TaxID=142650 RepID=A0A4P6MN92_9BACT|nr:hypothetical protein [Mycoplasmopsis phocirhinis]QBF34453.1 hypothetical protein EG856_00715 [Mycoplasmopsis phocirhinis]